MTGSGTTLLEGSSILGTAYYGGSIGLDGGRVLDNAGTLAALGNWEIELGFLVGGGTLDNLAAGTVDIETAGIIDGNLGATQFINAGTLLVASTAAGITDITTVFNNTGIVEVQSGTLSFDGGGYSNAGAFSVAAGATLGFGVGERSGSTFTLTGGSFNLAGTLQLGSGTLEFGALNETVSSYVQDGGILDGSGTFTATGSSLLYNTILQSGSGTTIFTGSSVFNGVNFNLDGGRVFENTGVLTLEGGGQVNLGNNPFYNTIGGGTLYNAAGATINIETNELFLAVTGTTLVRNAGLLEQTIATGQTVFDVAVTSTGTIDALSGTLAFVGAGSAFSGVIEGSGELVFAATSVFSSLTIGGTAALINEATITQAGTVTLGDANGAVASFVNEAGATYDIVGASLGAGTGDSIFSNDGTFTSSGTSKVASAFVNQATVQVGSGKLSFLGDLTNNGTITDQAATLTVAQLLSGTGTVAIGGGGTVTLSKGASSNSIVDFLGGTELLDLGAPKKFAGLIQDFAPGASIDLLKTPETGYSYANGILKITDNGKVVANLHFAGDLTQASFVVGSDGHGGTMITHS